MAARVRTDPEEVKNIKVNRETLSEAMEIFGYVKPYVWQFILGLVLLFLGSLVFMLFPLLIGWMVDIAQGKEVYDLTLNDLGVYLVVILVIQGVFSYARVMLFANVSERSVADLRLALYEKLVSLPVVFFEQSRVGELVSRLTSDVEKVYNTFSITLAEFIRQLIILTVGIALLIIITPELSMVMLATFPVIVIGGIIFGRYIRKMSKERQNKLADTNVILNESMQSIYEVKAFTNEWFELSRYSKNIHELIRISLKFAKGRAIFAVFIITVLFGALFFIIWQAAVMIQDGTITAGNLISFVSYTAILGGAIAGLGNFYTELLGAIGATERVRDILKTPEEVKVRPVSEQVTAPMEGHIIYQDVHFAYPTRQDMPVLKGLNLEIRPGQKVALVGPSGAGKSTIVQLLLQFYEYQDGHIKVDGKELKDFEITEFRRNLAIVPQEVMLFGGTIRENIAYGKPGAPDHEIIEAAKQSNSWEFIQSFPEGLDTLVGERGVKLSGGQRQRIAIARAILRDPVILLLDEATSSLDAESEKVVQDALNTLMEGRTSIIIAHRLATIREVDCIYVLDEGRIIEAGTHDELSEKEGGLYSSLARLQFELS